MRKEYKKVLIKEFTDKFLQCVNGFSKIEMRSPVGLSIFSKRIDHSERTMFVRLLPDSKREAFTVEVGWTRPNPFPNALNYGQPSAGRTEFNRAEFVCRLGFLFGQNDHWWHIAPGLNPFTDDVLEFTKRSLEPISSAQAVSRIAPLVDDAINKLISFGLPYLDEYSRSSSS